MKKFLTFILVLAMVLSVSSVAMAADSEATLKDELDAVTSGSATIITLSTDVTLSDTLTIDKNGSDITLDLGGNTLTGRINLKGGNLTVTNGTVSNPGGQALNVYADATDTADVTTKLTVLADATVNGGNAVVLFGYEASKPEAYNAQIDIYGTVNGTVFVSGNIKNSDSVVNINSPAKITSSSATAVGVALNGNATVNIETGTEVTGTTAVEVRAGKLKITGGKFTATGTAFDANSNNSGSSTSGAAVAVSSYDISAITVEITGGEFNGVAAFAETYEEGTGAPAKDIALSVEGGEFTGDVSSENEVDFISGGSFSDAPADSLIEGDPIVAEVADKTTVGEAATEEAAAANPGSEVVVKSGSGSLTVPEGTKVTVETPAAGTTVAPSVTVNGAPVNAGESHTVPVTQTTTKPSTGSGISVKYNGGNSFSTSNPAVPTGVEIDGVPVTFNGTGSNFSVGCISSDAKWVTVRWNSTTVTTNFTPDGLVECTTVSIPKTGDMSIWAAIAQFLGF